MKAHRPMILSLSILTLVIFPCAAWAAGGPQATASLEARTSEAGHVERPDDPYLPPTGRVGTARRWTRGSHVSVQVNVDADGNNLLGDAANEPSIAVDPNDPQRIAIGWRQFDNIESNFRQAGWAHSGDGGATWTFPGAIEPGVFRSDPVLAADAQGRFYYYSLRVTSLLECFTFASLDGGQSWGDGVYSFGGDKAWFEIDERPSGLGSGQIYASWSIFAGCCGNDQFNRSIDTGQSFEPPVAVSGAPTWGVVAIGPDGEVYVAGRSAFDASTISVARSFTIRDPDAPRAFDLTTSVDLGGTLVSSVGPNPGGLVGQVWIAVDRSAGPRRGHVYLLASIDPPGSDPLDVHFARSTDAGVTWSAPLRIHDDPDGTAWQWFGTLSVAPDGRLDAIWNDTRADPGGFDSVVYYAASRDGGLTWSAGEPLTPSFDPHLGWPQQNKLGDYYDMISDATGVHLAYAATFNGEQDVYYLHLAVADEIFSDGFESGDLSAWSE